MGYEYKCSCGAEFNTPAINIGRKEAESLYYRACPFCYKTMMIADEGAKAKPLELEVKKEPPRDPELTRATELMRSSPRFHKRVYEAFYERKCPCEKCTELSPMQKRDGWRVK
jgi:hypothetical protein